MRRSHRLGLIVASGALVVGASLSVGHASSGSTADSVGWVSGQLNTSIAANGDVTDSASWTGMPAPNPVV